MGAGFQRSSARFLDAGPRFAGKEIVCQENVGSPNEKTTNEHKLTRMEVRQPN